MKRRIRIIDKSGNIQEQREFKVSDLSHLDAQLRFPHKIEQPKKGKGSFKRKPKYGNDCRNDD